MINEISKETKNLIKVLEFKKDNTYGPTVLTNMVDYLDQDELKTILELLPSDALYKILDSDKQNFQHLNPNKPNHAITSLKSYHEKLLLENKQECYKQQELEQTAKLLQIKHVNDALTNIVANSNRAKQLMMQMHEPGVIAATANKIRTELEKYKDYANTMAYELNGIINQKKVETKYFEKIARAIDGIEQLDHGYNLAIKEAETIAAKKDGKVHKCTTKIVMTFKAIMEAAKSILLSVINYLNPLNLAGVAFGASGYNSSFRNDVKNAVKKASTEINFINRNNLLISELTTPRTLSHVRDKALKIVPKKDTINPQKKH